MAKKKASEKTAKVEEAKVVSKETVNIPEVEESSHVNTLSDDSSVPSVKDEAVPEFVEASVPEVIAELEEKLKNGELPNNAPVEKVEEAKVVLEETVNTPEVEESSHVNTKASEKTAKETKAVEHPVKKEEKPKRKTIDEVYGHCWFGVPY